MSSSKVYAIGLMSGTSLDGVDAALIRTDGVTVEDTGFAVSIPYTAEFQMRLAKLAKEPHCSKRDLLLLEHELTLKHADAVKKLLKKANIKATDVRIIGFHGQTIDHAPAQHVTWQIGDGSLLAEKTGIDVVCDMRRRDVAAGGQGAPLVPMFNLALIQKHAKPVALVNIGGSANVAFHGAKESDILAFDTGPGNSLSNDWVKKMTGKEYDKDGALACKGTPHLPTVRKFLALPFFAKKPPKSLDRYDFRIESFPKLSLEDGAATAAEIAAQGIALSVKHYPHTVKKWYITGGGRKNKFIIRRLNELLNNKVEPIESLSVNGDMVEAQAFAYLAIRSLKGLPLSLPSTTGVSRAITGGALYRR